MPIKSATVTIRSSFTLDGRDYPVTTVVDLSECPVDALAEAVRLSSAHYSHHVAVPREIAPIVFPKAGGGTTMLKGGGGMGPMPKGRWKRFWWRVWGGEE